MCLLHNHVFYAVPTHEFFSTIGLRSNSLHPSSISSLQPSSTSRQSQITRSQITGNIFFYEKTNHRSQRRRRRGLPRAGSTAGAAATATATAMAGAGPRRHIWPRAACARGRGVPSAEHGWVAPRTLDLEQQLCLVRHRLGGLRGRAGQQAAVGSASSRPGRHGRGASMHAGYDMWALDVIDKKKSMRFFVLKHMRVV